MKHISATHTNCTREYCPICQGGLFVCTVCGCAEGATTNDCPGVVVPFWALQQVYRGKLNFRDGAWRHERSVHSPPEMGYV